MSLITVAKPALYEFTEKKSKFIGLCFPVQNEEEAIAHINEIRKEHKSATHVVYAFSIGDNIQRSTDDGEPSGTAGRPVLEVIKNSGLNNIIVLVVRYFGGILLGTGGLVRAYTASAQGVLNAAEKAEIIPAVKMLVGVNYSEISALQYQTDMHGIIIESHNFGEKAMHTLLVPFDKKEIFQQFLQQSNSDYFILEEETFLNNPVLE